MLFFSHQPCKYQKSGTCFPSIFITSTGKTPILYLLKLFSYVFLYLFLPYQIILTFWLYSYRQTEVTSTLCCQRQHFGLLLPLVHVKIVISVYETVMKDKVLLLEESKCCLLVLPDSYSQYHRGVKEPLNIDDGRPTEVKKIHFDFLNPA